MCSSCAARLSTKSGAPAPNEEWLRQTSAFIRSAAAVIAPSEYLAGIARANLPGVPIEVIANGSGVQFASQDVPVHRDYRTPFKHVAIVLGAVGPHKGARMLEQTAERLEGTGIGIVVIGYLDESNLPSWHRPHLFVHGSYQDAEVASLVRAYGGHVALFTNQVPESFSYALSDLWAAGLPVIVPPTGALGDRVRAHGAGWILPAAFTADDVASLLERLFSEAGSAELARVESELDGNDNERVPRLDAMSRSLDALYRRFGIDPASAIDASSGEVQQLLATSLDGSLFRSEMIRFADEISQLRHALEHERSEHAHASVEMKRWIDKLQADVSALQRR
jgi:Glycosyltransferase